MNASGILRLLRTGSVEDFATVAREARIEDLIMALSKARSELSREQLVYALGERRDPKAVEVLLRQLHDRRPALRSTAADALAKIGDMRAAGPLLKLLLAEQDLAVRQELVAALGAMNVTEGIPALVQALKDPDSVVRHGAAWSLGEMKAVDSRAALQEALQVEDHPGNAKMIRWALRQIRSAEKDAGKQN